MAEYIYQSPGASRQKEAERLRKPTRTLYEHRLSKVTSGETEPSFGDIAKEVAGQEAAVRSSLPPLPSTAPPTHSTVERFYNASPEQLEQFHRHVFSGAPFTQEELAEVDPERNYGEYRQDYGWAAQQPGRLEIPLESRVKFHEKNMIGQEYTADGNEIVRKLTANLQRMRKGLQDGSIPQKTYDKMQAQWIGNYQNMGLEAREVHQPTTEETFQESTYTDLHGVRRQKRTRNDETYFERIDPDGVYVDADGKLRNSNAEAEAQLKMAEAEIKARATSENKGTATTHGVRRASDSETRSWVGGLKAKVAGGGTLTPEEISSLRHMQRGGQ